MIFLKNIKKRGVQLKIIETKNATCIICALGLSEELNTALFLRQVDYTVTRRELEDRTGAQILDNELVQHRDKHLMLVIEEEQVDKVEEIKMIDTRLSAVRKQLTRMEARGDVYSNSYQTLNNTIATLIKYKNEITEGQKIKVEGQLSIKDFVAQLLADEGGVKIGLYNSRETKEISDNNDS